MKRQFKLSDPGEGLQEAEVISWRVAVGDKVEINDVLVEVETAKSLVELPSPYAGEVQELLASEGDTVEVGAALVVIEDGEEAGDAPEATLVGYGAAAPEPGRRRRRRSPVTEEAPSRETAAPAPPQRRALATPLVRKVARDLGVRIDEVDGSGAGGRVTKRDVEAAAGAGSAAERVDVRGVRRATAENVTRSVQNHVHVTEWVEVDLTESMELIEHLRRRREFADLRVTPLLLVARATCLALRRTPELNSSWEGDQIAIHPDVNLGVAAATPRGLLVPNVRRAQELSLRELCERLNQLVATARAGALQPADLSGGTFTITNVGVFGIDGGTPIINGDESAILCMGAVQRRPWVVGTGDDERVVPRHVMTLSLSFDHRVVDGEEASRFLRDVADILSRPALALLY